MPYQNITGTINNATRDQILLKIDEARALLPYLINLTKTEKRKGRKLGKKTEKFLFDVQQITNQQPQFVPGFVNKPGFDNDFNQLIILLAIEHKLQTLHEAVKDTRLALIHECQQPALAVYDNIKKAAATNTPGADTALAMLQPYFKKIRKKKIINPNR